jgi:hypothetical protein
LKYVLVMNTPVVELIKIAVDAIRVEPIIVLRSDWTASRFFFSLSCQNSSHQILRQYYYCPHSPTHVTSFWEL